MNNQEKYIQLAVYHSCGLPISDFKQEVESTEYQACRFKVSGSKVISRKAKITPKKVGQFVTFWKRNGNGPIEPFEEKEDFDFFVVNVKNETRSGQFVFPKAILLKKGILSTETKEGKRAFRVYPVWDAAKSKQAVQTQKWQLDYFFEINTSLNMNKVKELYSKSAF